MSAKRTIAVVGWNGDGRGEGARRTLVGEVGARCGVDLVVSQVGNILLHAESPQGPCHLLVDGELVPLVSVLAIGGSREEGRERA